MGLFLAVPVDQQFGHKKLVLRCCRGMTFIRYNYGFHITIAILSQTVEDQAIDKANTQRLAGRVIECGVLSYLTYRVRPFNIKFTELVWGGRRLALYPSSDDKEAIDKFSKIRAKCINTFGTMGISAFPHRFDQPHISLGKIKMSNGIERSEPCTIDPIVVKVDHLSLLRTHPKARCRRYDEVATVHLNRLVYYTPPVSEVTTSAIVQDDSSD